MIPTCRADVKSDEEWRMILWLHEATDHGMVVRWEYEPESFVLFPKGTYKAEKKLKTKTKVINRFLHHPATYTPDFVIEFSHFGLGYLGKYFEKGLSGYPECQTAYIDCKGSFNPYQNDQRFFGLVQKAMWARHRIWPQKVIPFEKKVTSSLFLKTWAPDACRHTKRGGLNACGRACRNVISFLHDADVGDCKCAS